MRFLAVLIFFVVPVLGNKRGAPCSALSDIHMSPNHGARAQTTVSPFRLAVLNDGARGELVDDEVITGNRYRIVIDHSPDVAIKGFMIRAMYEDPKRPDAGSFIDLPLCTRLVKWCGAGAHYVTHRVAGGCGSKPILLKWRAPSEVKDNLRVFFQATVVLDYKTFWTDIITPSYEVVPKTTTTKKAIRTKPTLPPTLPPTTQRRTTKRIRTRPPPPTTSGTFPPTTTLVPMTHPPFDPSCGIEDGPDCLDRLRIDYRRKFCEIEGWVDYCPQLCCYKAKGIKSPYDA